VRTPLIVLGLLTASATASAHEPWVDPDPDGPPERYEIGAVGVRADAEYRAQYTFINPLDLVSEDDKRANYLNHRARFSVMVDYEDAIKIATSVDVLDGVLWGDNGTFTGQPSSDSGLNLTARDPNVVKPCVAYAGEGDPLDASSYKLGLCEADILLMRRLYAQVNTPVGVIRVGRQPVGVGMSVQNTDGDGRRNRFGVAGPGDYVDRVMFATKPLEGFKPEGERNLSETEGFFTALIYDRWVSDRVVVFGDDIHMLAGAVRWVEPNHLLGEDLELTAFYAHRWDNRFSSNINVVGGRFATKLEGGFHFGFDMAGNIGSTKEVSESYSLITNDPVVDQEILQYGARAVLRFDQPMWTAYMEMDYASGDEDPRPGTPLSQFRFSEDTNVGLLMFEHVVAYQSARASAAATEVVRRLGATTFPTERIDTRGAFTGAFALYPQFDIRPHESLLFRGGALVAWAPERLVDPVQSLQDKDGATIEDDLVNFVGGVPGNFYGVELDARFQWRVLDHFALDLETAVLFPGDALQDVNGQAVNSYLGQARTTFFF
jgi:hypothetical protein